MTRRTFLCGLTLGTLSAPLAAGAQQAGKVYQVGILSPTSQGLGVEAFRQGLRALGYVEGRNIVIEYRSAEGRFDRLPDLAAELVRLRVEVIVAVVTQASLAAKNATTTIPIVMLNVGDPVGAGLVTSLARPGSNVTGTSVQAVEIAAKSLEVLKHVLPKLRRVAVLWNPANPVFQAQMVKETEAAARARAVEIFQRLNTLAPGAVGAEELTPEERPFLRFEAEAQELFDGWRADLEHRLRAEEDHPVLLSHLAKYRSLLPSLALIFHLIDSVDAGTGGPVSRAAAAQAAAWCEYLAAHARRLYAAVADAAQVAAALLATRLAGGRLASPFSAREVYRQEWTGLTEPRVVQNALECLEELGWIRPEAVRAPAGGRPTIRYHLNPWLRADGPPRARPVRPGGAPKPLQYPRR